VGLSLIFTSSEVPGRPGNLRSVRRLLVVLGLGLLLLLLVLPEQPLPSSSSMVRLRPFQFCRSRADVGAFVFRVQRLELADGQELERRGHPSIMHDLLAVSVSEAPTEAPRLHYRVVVRRLLAFVGSGLTGSGGLCSGRAIAPSGLSRPAG